MGNSVSARTGTKLSRSVAQGLATSLNGVLNRTVSDSRLVVAPIAGYADAFALTRLVEGEDAPLELDGTTRRLYVQQVVVVEDGRCRTESYAYRLQADESPKSWLIRWEYVRDPPSADRDYPRSHIHVNGTFPDNSPIGRVHIASPKVALEAVIGNLISDWAVKPRTKNWKAILQDSAKDFGGPG